MMDPVNTIIALGGLAALGVAWRRIWNRDRKPATTPPSVIRAVAGNFRPLYEYWGQQRRVDPDLLQAIARVESGERADAVNRGDPSYGLGQVLCRTEPGSNFCTNELPALPEWRGATPARLLTPEFNVQIFSGILAWNLSRFSGDEDRAIVAYNNWSAALQGRLPNGRFPKTSNTGLDPNEYLQRVRNALARIRGAGIAT